MKSLAVARKPYKARNDKELSVKPGDVFEVLDDDGAWWCLRAPSGKTGHVPKYHLEPISNPMAPYGRNYDPPTDPIVVKVPVIVKTSVHKEASEEPARSRTPPSRTQQQRQVTRSASPAPAPASPPPPPPPTPLSRSLSQIQPTLSSSRLERSPESRPEVRTYIKEIVRRSPEPIRGSRFIRSTSRRPRRHSGSTSSSDDDSSNYENEPKKSYAPRAARSSRAQTQHSPAGRNCSKIPHCCEGASCHVHCFRHPCVVHCPKDKKSRQTPPQSPARSEQSQQQQDKQPQQVFIILEPPKQEQPPEVEPPEEYQDPCQTAPIQILLTPGGQFTSSMTVAPQFPQYGQAQQAAMQMCAPAAIQWPCQPYYPTYV
ncbi:T cell receptor binding [Sparganum proliferum]